MPIKTSLTVFNQTCPNKGRCMRAPNCTTHTPPDRWVCRIIYQCWGADWATWPHSSLQYCTAETTTEQLSHESLKTLQPGLTVERDGIQLVSGDECSRSDSPGGETRALLAYTIRAFFHTQQTFHEENTLHFVIQWVRSDKTSHNF